MLGRYRIEDVLGQGQTGVVYLAFDTSIERSVAIKCLKTNTPDGNWTNARSPIEVLFDEAKVIGQLNHSQIGRAHV